MDERLAFAMEAYELAVFTTDASELAAAERGLNGLEADLALARGRVMHARFLDARLEDPNELPSFQRAAGLYHQQGDARGEAEALFWVGCFHQVVRRDDAAAVEPLERSRALAAGVGDALTTSYALRHLAMLNHFGGRLDVARRQMEESVRLRREVGFLPGVAANLVGLAYIAAEEDRHEEAVLLLDEAAEICESTGADRIMSQVTEARAALH